MEGARGGKDSSRSQSQDYYFPTRRALHTCGQQHRSECTHLLLLAVEEVDELGEGNDAVLIVVARSLRTYKFSSCAAKGEGRCRAHQHGLALTSKAHIHGDAPRTHRLDSQVASKQAYTACSPHSRARTRALACVHGDTLSTPIAPILEQHQANKHTRLHALN